MPAGRPAARLYPTRHLIFCWSDLMLKSDQKIWYEFDRYIGQTPIKNLHIPWSKNLIGEYGGFWSEFDQYIDRTCELHTKYLSNFHIKYISRSVCLVGQCCNKKPFDKSRLDPETRNTRPPVSNPIMWQLEKVNVPPKLFFLTIFWQFVMFF
jgi:hypothetical protein